MIQDTLIDWLKYMNKNVLYDAFSRSGLCFGQPCVLSLTVANKPTRVTAYYTFYKGLACNIGLNKDRNRLAANPDCN